MDLRHPDGKSGCFSSRVFSLFLRPHKRRESILLHQFRVRHISDRCQACHGHPEQISCFPIVEPERELIQIALQMF